MGLLASPCLPRWLRLAARGLMLSIAAGGINTGPLLARPGADVLLGGLQLSASGRAAPKIRSVYIHQAAGQAGARYEVLIESNESIKKGQALLASAEFRVPGGWQIQLGQRWLPGPPTRWLRDPDRISGHPDSGHPDTPGRLPALPDGRRLPLAFARQTGLAWLPGIFGLGRERMDHGDRSNPTTRRAPRDGGLFWSGPDYLFAFGREHAALNLRARLPLFDARHFFRLGLDVVREPVLVCDSVVGRANCDRRRTAGGRAWLLANRVPEFFTSSLYLERRSEWDLINLNEENIARSQNRQFAQASRFGLERQRRHGRSGLASARLRLARRLELSAAGQDRGQRGFRVAEAALQPALWNFSQPGGVLRGVVLVRYREQRWYGAAAAELPASGKRLESFERLSRAVGGLGLRFESVPAETVVQVLGSAEHRGGRILTLDAETGHRQAGWRLRFGLAYGRFPENEPVFLFLRAPQQGGGSGVRFISDSSAALIVQLHHKWFSLYLESRVQRADRKTSSFASIAFRARL